MSEYAVLAGVVQKFGTKDTMTYRDVEVGGDSLQVTEFTVKASGSQTLVRVTLWPEFEDIEVYAGDGILAEGKFSQSKGKGDTTFYNLSAKSIAIIPASRSATRSEVTPKAQAAVAENPPF